MSRFVPLVLLILCACGPLGTTDAGAGGGGGNLFAGGGGGGTGGGAVGGGASDGGTGGGAAPRAECVGQPLPADFGAQCAAGSNLALCVMANSTTCSAPGVCVWDSAAPGTRQAYCTVGCTPSANDCPTGFECRAQDCSNGPANVCVKRGVSGCAPVPAFGASGRVEVATPIPGLGLFAVGYLSGSDLRVLLMQGTTLVRDLGSVPQATFGAQALGVVGDDVWWSVPPRVVRIGAQTMEVFTPTDADLSFLAVARTPGGDVLQAQRRSDRQMLLLVPDGGSLLAAPGDPVVTEEHARLPSGGVLGQCPDAGLEVLCESDNLRDVRLVPLPSGVRMPMRDWSLSVTANELLVLNDAFDVHRRIGGEWIRDALQPGARSGVFTTVGSDRYLTRREADGGLVGYREEPSCWRRLAPGSRLYDSLPAPTYGYYSTRNWCSELQPR